MNTKLRPKVLTVSLLLIVIISCKQPNTPDYQGIQSLEISKIGVNDSHVSAVLKFYNTNPYGVRIKHADVDILLDDKPAGHCVIDSLIMIPARDSFYLPVTVNINLGSIINNAFKLLTQGQIKIDVNGYVSIKKGLLGFRVPVHHEEYQKLSDILEQIH